MRPRRSANCPGSWPFTGQNPGCIRPDHLEAMTAADHMRLHAELRTG